MRLLESLIQAIAALVILIIPLVIVYWVLSTLAIEPIAFITKFLGSFLEPPISILRGMLGDRSFNVYEFEVDLIPLFFSAILLVVSIALTAVAKVLESFRSSLNFVKAKTKVHIVQKQREEEKLEEEKKLLKNTNGFVVVRYKTQTTSSAYLTSSGLSPSDIKDMFMEYFNKYTYLDAELSKESKDDNLFLIFDDVPGSLIYTLQLQDNMVKLNQQLDKAGTKLIVTCGIYCAPATESRSDLLFVTNKICNLAAPGEVTCSRAVKDIFEKDRADSTLFFISKGMYDLGRETEIFTVRKPY